MHKITKQLNGKYTVVSYSISKYTNYPKEVWSATNLDASGVAHLLEGRLHITIDLQDIFAIVDLTKCPALVTDGGRLSAVSGF